MGLEGMAFRRFEWKVTYCALKHQVNNKEDSDGDCHSDQGQDDAWHDSL
jgi:hypothetical protein